MKKITFLLIGALGISSLIAQNNPTYKWVKNTAWGISDQKISSMDNDNQGNLYCGGLVINNSGTTTYFNNGDSVLYTDPSYDGFLAKLDSNGAAIWTKPFAQGSNEGITNVVISPSQELIVSSYTDHAVTIDGINIPGRALYIFRYDLNGVLQSSVVFDVNDTFYRLDNLSVDQNGNAYISGFFNGSITFGATTIAASNGGIFHVKVDANNNVKWIKQFSGRTWDMKIANDGNLLIAGECPSSAQFGSFNAGSTGYALPFIVKLDSTDGTPLFLHTPSSFNGGEARSIVQDNDNNIYLGGFFGKNAGPLSSSILDFGNFTITPIGGNSTTGFLAKYSSNGVPLWAKTMGGGGQGRAHKMEIRNDIITVRGEMDANCLFPNTNDSILIRTFDNAPYFATIDTSGLWIGARATSFSHGSMSDFLQTNSGSLYFTGWFNNTYTYNDGQDSAVSIGGSDGVIAKLNDISTVLVNAPSNLQVTGHGSNGWNATTDISWNDNTTDEYGFFYFAEDINGATYGATITSVNVTTGTVGFIWDGVVYDYAVYAHKYDMLSEPSNIVTDTASFVTSINTINLTETELTAYPNPSHGQVNLKSNNEIINVSIYNLQGKQVVNTTINAKEAVFNLEHFPKGMYVINIIFNEGSLSKRLILE